MNTLTHIDKYKNDFAIKFAQLMQKELPEWKKAQAEERKKLYTSYVKWYLFAFALGFMPGKRETDYMDNLEIHFWLGVVFFITAIITGIIWANKDYQNSIKRTLFPQLLKVFSEKIYYHRVKIPKYVYDSCGLFKYNVSYSDVDDYFNGEYNDVKFQIDETELTHTIKYKNGKSDTKELFKGVAMQFEMQKEINARVLIYSKSLLNRVPKGYEKVTLEYEKFNKKYDLYVQNTPDSEGQIEARYLFNTAFLDRFMQLQTSFRVSKMKCSIYKNNILMLLETQKDLFEMNHLLGRVDDNTQYRRLFDEFASVLSFIDVLNLASRTGL